jgi:polar amino acid transport system substrate-binding protein
MTRSRLCSTTSALCRVSRLFRSRLRPGLRATIASGMLLATVLGIEGSVAAPGWARSLDSIRYRGTIGLCAHPNSLPFASRDGQPPGFQLELGRALAQKLGVSLTPVWVVSPIQIRRADCDMVLDAISNTEAQSELGLTLSKPYYRGGVILAVRSDSRVASFQDLDARSRVGVQVGSVTAMLLDQRGVPTSVFGFEDEMLQAVAQGEVDAAAVTPAAAGYYNITHPDRVLQLVGPDEREPDLAWNISAGMLKPDKDLRGAIDLALDQLRAEGAIEQIYARYGMALHAPK